MHDGIVRVIAALRPGSMRLAIPIVDLVTMLSVGAAAVAIKATQDPALPLDLYGRLAPATVVLVLVFGAMGLYSTLGINPAEELRRVVLATTLFFISLAGATFLVRGAEDWSRQVFLGSWAGICITVPVMRNWWRRQLAHLPWWGIPVVIIGAGRTGRQVAERLRRLPWMGLRPVAFLDDDPALAGNLVDELPVAGVIADQAPLLAQAGVAHAIVAMPSLAPDRQSPLLDLLTSSFSHICLAPGIPGAPSQWATTHELANILVLEIRSNLLRPGARIAKRIQDLIMVALLGLVAVPFTLAMLVVIPLTSSGPTFYSQKRIGRDGRHFMAWKFRSMVGDADAVLVRYLEAHPELREEWERDHKLRDDPRITAVGRLLRRTSLDELPQLWNVLTGEMSLVGPRPIVDGEVEKYGDHFPLYTKVRPGLTGLWQVSGRNDTTYEERVALDAYYVRNWSVWLDLVIVVRTVRVVLLGSGAY